MEEKMKIFYPRGTLKLLEQTEINITIEVSFKDLYRDYYSTEVVIKKQDFLPLMEFVKKQREKNV